MFVGFIRFKGWVYRVYGVYRICKVYRVYRVYKVYRVYRVYGLGLEDWILGFGRIRFLVMGLGPD